MHIPLQSGSDTILKLMNRKYDCEQFYHKIQKIKEALPDVALTTDVIVGFPQEEEKHFKETYDFIKKCGFHMLHVFPFSAREGTKAYAMSGQVDPKIKKERVDSLLELSKQLWNDYVERFIGKELDVLIEKIDKETHTAYGHTSNYIDVAIPNSDAKPGKIVSINIQKSMIVSK